MTFVHPDPSQEPLSNSRIELVAILIAIWGWPMALRAEERPASVAERPVVFEAVWPDGARVVAPRIDDWTGDGQQAKITGRKIFTGTNPVRSLRNTALLYRPIEGPLIEFIQGDIFPARVIGQVSNPDALAAVLLARPERPVDLPGAESREAIRVQSQWIRRVVWTSEVREELRPSTAFRRDGSSLAYTRLRFQADGLHLLTDNQILSVGWEELAELHFPAGDWWSQYAQEMAVLSPDLQTPLVRLTTGAGMRLTTSLSQFQIWDRAERPTLKDTYHILQPAWSADVLCVSRAEVRQYSVSVPTAVPLSVIEPSRSEHRPVFSRLLSHWNRDANVLGGPLVSGRHEYAWGLATCGGHELEYPLPPAATRVTTRFGLDRAAGLGGCVRGRLEWTTGNGAGNLQALRTSEILRGSESDPAVLDVELPAHASPSRLRLVSDPVNEDAPAGADGFDIRDYCDWLEPQLELKREAWLTQVAAAIPASYPALAGWKIDAQPGRDWRPATHWDATARPYPAFHREWVLTGFPITLSRTIKVPKQGAARWHIQAYRANRAAPACRLEGSINQRPLARMPLAEFTPGGLNQPLTIDLSGFAGREMQVELRFVPLAGETRIVWEGAEFEVAPGK
jgi:hypothetical protein